MSDAPELTPDLEERLARYRAGAMSDDERATFEREALVNDALAEALYAEVSLDGVRRAAGAPPRIIPLPPRRGHPWWRGARFLVPVAAGMLAVSAVALWMARPHAPAPGGDWLRGESPMAALEPIGTLETPPERFRWTRDPGAASYRVELFDTSGNAMGTGVSRDTTLAFSAVAHAPLAAGEWRVVAIGADGLERAARSRAAFRVVAK